jgi:HPt (histidine-containing phosphotransfer) domain-containing protein
MAERIRVAIDPDIVELIPGYLHNRREDLGRLRAGVAAADFDRVRLLGHSMKGSGGGYGFDVITELGGRMETAALARDGAAVLAAVAELEDYLRRVEVVIG